MTATSETQIITTRAELEALATHTEVRDNEGDVWRKLWTGRWVFRCRSGWDGHQQSSQWLIGFAPLTIAASPQD